MIKFSKYFKTNEEMLDGLHFEEALKISYEKETNPFPMNVAIWFENEKDYYFFTMTDANLVLEEKGSESDNNVMWPMVRQTVFNYMKGKEKGVYFSNKHKYLYVTLEGMKELVENFPKRISYVGDENLKNCKYVIYETTVLDFEQLSIVLESKCVNFYKKYKYEE